MFNCLLIRLSVDSSLDEDFNDPHLAVGPARLPFALVDSASAFSTPLQLLFLLACNEMANRGGAGNKMVAGDDDDDDGDCDAAHRRWPLAVAYRR